MLFASINSTNSRTNPLNFQKKIKYWESTILKNSVLRLLYWCFLNVLNVQSKLSGWYENPINSKVLVIPLDKAVFPTITLCPRDSRPDRWGSVMKIFDHLKTECVSKRWDYEFNEKQMHRGAFVQFSFRWIYYYGSNKSTRKETGKTHLCALAFHWTHILTF